MRRIEIDEDVYTELARHVVGFEQPNDVLRRLLLKDAPSSNGREPTRTATTSIPGALAALIAQEYIGPGDELVHVQVRKGRRFTATVEPDGWIRTDVKRYREPSPALGELVGTSIDGWAYWTHERSGKTLRQLRKESGGKGRGER